MRRSFSFLSLLLILSVFASASTRAAVPIPKAPDVDARAWILLDFDSGKVMAEQNAT